MDREIMLYGAAAVVLALIGVAILAIQRGAPVPAEITSPVPMPSIISPDAVAAGLAP